MFVSTYPACFAGNKFRQLQYMVNGYLMGLLAYSLLENISVFFKTS